MSNHFPITPSPELVEQWLQEHWTNYDLARQAAQWGADQELEATLGLMATLNIRGVDYVRNARRSARAPSLKAQALDALREAESTGCLYVNGRGDTIRRALGKGV